MPRLMLGAMDIFLFPSFFEGSGLVILEAQTAGLPCVISDTIPEEATVIKPLIIRLSLGNNYEWLKNIFLIKNSKKIMKKEEALNTIEKTTFNIKINIEELCSFYMESI